MIETEAIVLHAFDYRETSRIVRLVTRDHGVVSAIAKGARRPKSRFGQGLDLFTSGVAHLSMHQSRDLHALTAFDATRARPELAGSLARFGAAAALGELCLRFGTDAPPTVHEVLVDGFDALGKASRATAAAVGLATAWRLIAEIGFAPSLDRCAVCHRELRADEETRFSHRAGGAVCTSDRSAVPGSRVLPADARATLVEWLDGKPAKELEKSTERAHQRLLREFLEEHLTDGRPMKALAAWTSGTSARGSAS